MDIQVFPPGILIFGDKKFRCAIGRGGVSPHKSEGDGSTPSGRFPLHGVFYRPDRHPPPETSLPLRALTAEDGWCDDGSHPSYNRLVRLPFEGSHEKLWRDDGVYDVIVELGYNDTPVVPGRGSAIFLHVARPDYDPTEGCIALALDDLLWVLKQCGAETMLSVSPDP